MLNDKYLWHVTLNTGDKRRSWRHEVDDKLMVTFSQLLTKALSGNFVAIPVVQPICHFKIATQGQCMIATVYRQDIPLVTLGVAGDSPCSADLWRVMHDSYSGIENSQELKTDRNSPPEGLWCGARIEVGLAMHRDAAKWLADFERCIAWAWLEGHISN
jgi:hypothetical protein